MRNHRNLNIWNEAIHMTKAIYHLSLELPASERFGLKSQTQRSALSIASNIAEGCSGSNKRLIKFIDIALGSSYELETQLLILAQVYPSVADRTKFLIQELVVLQKRIHSYRNYIETQLD